jgi:hypothetical protein
MDQKGALALGALAGAAAALLLRRRTTQAAPPAVRTAVPPDEDVHRRLDEARAAQADEADFAAAGMGAETIVEDEPPGEPAPANEFEAMRRRVHEEARAAAEEMRRRAETDA